MAKKTTTISVESDLIDAAKKRRINISQISEAALKGVLGVDDSIPKLQKKRDQLTAQLMAVTSELGRLEGQALKSVTDQQVKDAVQERKDEIFNKFLENRKRIIQREGSFPAPMFTHWARELDISVDELILMAEEADEQKKLQRKQRGDVPG